MSQNSIPADQIEFAKHALRRMIFVRGFEQKCLDLSTSNSPVIAGSVHLCAGQEAIPVGACAALGEHDKVIATYRGHGWALEAGLQANAVFSEICHREGGVNGGRGGSAYIMGEGGRFVGENSIVGAGGPVANGIAIALRQKGSDGVVLVSFGDGAMNQGALHEAFVFAVAQKLPVIFICENNGWSELTPTTRIVPFDRMSRRGNGYGLQSATIDGCDPLAVRATLQLASERARRGEGPSLVECSTVRLWGHYNRDIEHYRPKTDRATAEARDPIVLLASRLIDQGILTADEIDALRSDTAKELDDVVAAATASPVPDASSAKSFLYATNKTQETVIAPEEVEWTYQQAVNEALRAELAERPEVLVFGEDVGHAGGIFGCSRNLQREFGAARVFDTPIAEAAILGAAVGASIGGMRPVAEIMWMDFILVALDQLINQAANVRYVSRGKLSAPMVVRVQQGATPGSCSQHSQSLEAFFAHVPGLKVGLPATPQDAYDMLRAAINDPDPCIIIEARSLYQTKDRLARRITPVGTANLRRKGRDLLLVSWGAMIHTAERVANGLAKDGLDVAVLDMRWLNPLDMDALVKAVKDCGGRALVVHEASQTGGFGAEIVARLLEHGFTQVARLGARDCRIPASPILQAEILPTEESIESAVRKLLSGKIRSPAVSSAE